MRLATGWLLGFVFAASLGYAFSRDDPTTPYSIVAIRQCGTIMGGVVTTKDGKVHGFPFLPQKVRDRMKDVTEDSIIVIDAPCGKDPTHIVKIPRTDRLLVQE